MAIRKFLIVKAVIDLEPVREMGGRKLPGFKDELEQIISNLSGFCASDRAWTQ